MCENAFCSEKKVKEEAHMLRGWECPVCGRGVSPYVSFCPCNSTLSPLPVYAPIPISTPHWPLDYTTICGGSSCGL